MNEHPTTESTRELVDGYNTKQTTEQICKAIALDFKEKGITHQIAAERLGKTTSAVTNQISGKKPFSRKTAEQYAKEFGYSVYFLLYGEGELHAANLYDGNCAINLGIGIFGEEVISRDVLSATVYLAELLLHLTDNKDAIDSWNAIMSADYELFKKKIKPLIEENKKNGRYPITMAELVFQLMEKSLVPFIKKHGVLVTSSAE